MWFRKNTFLGFMQKIEQAVKTLTILKTLSMILGDRVVELDKKVTALSAQLTEITLKLDALRTAPPPSALLLPPAPVSAPTLQAFNLFDELPVGSDHGFSLDELTLDAGYKEHA